MIEQLAEETVTEYASDTQTVQEPYGSDYSQGVRVGRTIPAKWWNWLFNAVTKRMSQAKSDLSKMLLELQNVILHTGRMLDSTDYTQLATAVQAISTDSISDYRQQYNGFLKRWEELCPDYTDGTFAEYDSRMLQTSDVACAIVRDSSLSTGRAIVFSERLCDGTWRWHKLSVSANQHNYIFDFAQGNVLFLDYYGSELLGTFVLLGFKNYFRIGYGYFYMGTRAYFLRTYNSNYSYLYALNDQGGAIKVGEAYTAGISVHMNQSGSTAVDFGDYYVIGNLKYIKATMQLEIIHGDIDATLAIYATYRLASGNCAYLMEPTVSSGPYRIKIFNGQSIVNGLETYSFSYVAQTGAIFVSTRRSEGSVYVYTYAISFDGLTSVPTEGLYSGVTSIVFYSGGRYYEKYGYTSIDGIHWSRLDKPGSYLIPTDIDGVLLSVTAQYVVWISFDGGVTWTVTDIDASLGQYIYSNYTSIPFKFDSLQAMSAIYKHNGVLKRIRSLRINNKVIGHTFYLS